MPSPITRIAPAAGAVALTLAAAPSAHAAGAVFGGSTSEDDAIVLTADRKAKKLKSAVLAAPATCDDGREFAYNLRVVPTRDAVGPRDLRMSRNAKGRFSGTQEASVDIGGSTATLTAKVAGKLKAKRAKGTLSVDVAITGAQPGACHTGTINWSAMRSPGRVYGGVSSQEEPVVIRLNGKRRSVSDLYFGWQSSTCTPDAFIRFGEHYVDFPLRGGGFGDSWSEPYDGQDGGKVTFDYDVAGTLKAKSANGTVRVTRTDTDAAGATTLACDSGGVTWKAATG